MTWHVSRTNDSTASPRLRQNASSGRLSDFRVISRMVKSPLLAEVSADAIRSQLGDLIPIRFTYDTKEVT